MTTLEIIEMLRKREEELDIQVAQLYEYRKELQKIKNAIMFLENPKIGNLKSKRKKK